MPHRFVSNRLSRIGPRSVVPVLVGVYAVLFAFGYYRAGLDVRYPPPEPDEPELRTDRRILRLRTAGNPLQQDLANGVYKPGDRIEALFLNHVPDLVVIHPPYSTGLYFRAVSSAAPAEGTTVIAKNGRITAAKTDAEVDVNEFETLYFWGSLWLIPGYFAMPDRDPDRVQQYYPNVSMALCGSIVGPVLRFPVGKPPTR